MNLAVNDNPRIWPFRKQSKLNSKISNEVVKWVWHEYFLYQKKAIVENRRNLKIVKEASDIKKTNMCFVFYMLSKRPYTVSCLLGITL